jgi:hypothetical protein
MFIKNVAQNLLSFGARVEGVREAGSQGADSPLSLPLDATKAGSLHLKK